MNLLLLIEVSFGEHNLSSYAINSLMFVGINVCIFETKLCLRRLIFAVSSGLVNYLAMNYVCGYLFLRFKDCHEFQQINPSQTLMKLQCSCDL